jgi:FixJ family two-component response regulator
VSQSPEEVPFVSVVDDDPSVRRSLRSLLLSSGFRGKAFASGAAFLAAPELAETRCLILDLAMPEMSGPELVCELRATRRLMPYVVLTASGVSDHATNQLWAGEAVAWLKKPASGSELLDSIRIAVTKDPRGRIGR